VTAGGGARGAAGSAEGGEEERVEAPYPAAVSVETGLADVITLQRRRQARLSAHDEESFFVDTLSECQWARAVRAGHRSRSRT
jgi:hypothetical protein